MHGHRIFTPKLQKPEGFRFKRSTYASKKIEASSRKAVESRVKLEFGIDSISIIFFKIRIHPSFFNLYSIFIDQTDRFFARGGALI